MFRHVIVVAAVAIVSNAAEAKDMIGGLERIQAIVNVYSAGKRPWAAAAPVTAAVVVSNAAIAKDLTAAEQQQRASRLSVTQGLDAAYARWKAAEATRRNFRSNSGGCLSVTGCRSLVDVSALAPGHHPQPNPPPSPGAYNAKIEARALEMFPYGSQREERGRWMAEQEQREIANEINRSKPLIYPAR